MKAPKTLKGKQFGVREQFPKTIEEKRRLLYPEMKRARLDPNNKVRLVKDKVCINNVQHVPQQEPVPENATIMPNRNRHNTYHRQNVSQIRQYTRTFQNSSNNRYGTKGRGAKPKYGHGWSNDDFSNRGRYLGNNMPKPTKKTINFNIEQVLESFCGRL